MIVLLQTTKSFRKRATWPNVVRIHRVERLCVCCPASACPYSPFSPKIYSPHRLGPSAGRAGVRPTTASAPSTPRRPAALCRRRKAPPCQETSIRWTRAQLAPASGTRSRNASRTPTSAPTSALLEPRLLYSRPMSVYSRPVSVSLALPL
eukprot:7382799-Prymnesium_polylepis.1